MGLIPGLVQWVKGSGITAAAAKFAAKTWIQSQAQELTYATGATTKIKGQQGGNTFHLG